MKPLSLLEEQARRALAVEAAQPGLAVERAGCVLAALPEQRRPSTREFHGARRRADTPV